MVGFPMAAIPYMLTVLLCLPCAALGATLHSEKEERRSMTMRREAPVHTAYLGALGEILTETQSSVTSGGDSFCDYHFSLGKDASNDCIDAKPITQESMCIYASTESGASTDYRSFRKAVVKGVNLHPMGCFKAACADSPNGVCYFYNEAPTPSTGNITGTPVCYRRKHAYGTNDTNGGCPAGYEVLDDEKRCRSSAVCLDKGEGDHFRIGVDEHNASKHLDYPRGCFVHQDGRMVYYNGPSHMGVGSNVQGTPICEVPLNTTLNWKTQNLVKESADADMLTATDSESDFCNYDFPLGKPNTNDCSDLGTVTNKSVNRSLIMQESMCMDAAVLAGATIPKGSFRVPVAEQMKYPKGCFKKDCGEASPKTCYFHNEKESLLPKNVSGTPVCSRPKYFFGAPDSTALDGGCPDGYKVLDEEGLCRSTAQCLGHGRGAEFRIGEHNASKHLLFPRGCFVNAGDRQVYYNGPSKMGTGVAVKGTPICVVAVPNATAS